MIINPVGSGHPLRALDGVTSKQIAEESPQKTREERKKRHDAVEQIGKNRRKNEEQQRGGADSQGGSTVK